MLRRSSHQDHPIRRLVDAGARVCVNTDDPKMFGNTLAEEYRLLSQNHHFTAEEIRRLVFAAVDMSWLPANRKEKLRGTLLTRFATADRHNRGTTGSPLE